MNTTNRESIRSEAGLAQIITNVANTVQPDAVICAVESKAFAQRLCSLSERFRLIVATTNRETYDLLSRQANLEAIHLPILAADKYRQVLYIISVAFRAAKVSIGDFVVCAIGPDVYQQEGNLVILADVEPSVEEVSVPDLLKLTDGVRPSVIETAVMVACKIGRAARRGKRIGTIFTLGDSIKVLEGSKQLIPNPFEGHEKSLRMLTNPEIHDALIELAKLDGAFVVRGDGFIQTAGVYLNSPDVEVDLPAGFGARHTAAAAVTKRTDATAVVISATDGNVRAFADGKMVLQIDPEIEHIPIT